MPTSSRCSLLVVAALMVVPAAAAAQGPARGDSTPTLGLEQGRTSHDTPELRLELVRASQTAAALRPRDSLAFDFTPGDWLQRRAANGNYQLGDLDLRMRPLRPVGTGEWRDYSTAAARRPVTPLAAGGRVLAAADLAPTLPADIPLRVRRYWEVQGGHLALRFELRNEGAAPVEVGGLGIPMVFDNILTDRTLEQAHAVASFHDPYIGEDAGYVQVTRLSGQGPVLLVVPLGRTPLEAWRPLLDERTRRGITFEGFYEWMPRSLGYAQREWREAEPWNRATSDTLQPGQTRSYGVAFLLAPSIRRIEATLAAAGRPVAVGIPGYVLPTDLDGRLFLKSPRPVREISVEPAGALTIAPAGTARGGWRAYTVKGRTWGRARVTVTYADGSRQTIHYKVIKPAAQVVDDLGRFLTTQQWFERPGDPFGRSPSVISYDIEARRQVTEDNRVWIAGLGDEGGAGSWLAAVLKQLLRPDSAQLTRLERFVDGVLWGGLQYADGPQQYGVRKSMFYYAPQDMPPGTYSDSVRYGGWSSWDRKEATSVGRSYDYPHVAAAYWVLYRLARDRRGLVTNHPWEWYLERAYETGQAMVRYAPHYSQFGQMEGTVFVLILLDLKREGWNLQAAALEATMRRRAEVWRSLAYPFGSEMPWDSTGQEEVYAWCRYFGFDDKAAVTLNAILGYMPTVPHWGYNGSARRYWDFQYAGKLRRIERQLHHYGSGINAIPVLSEFRSHPDDFYLLRVGYGGTLGAIANITQEGFGPSAFHAYPATLRIDGYSGDYGPNFFGYTVNAATYLVHHPDFGWLAFGGNVQVQSVGAEARGRAVVRVEPLDGARARVYLAPFGLWLTLDAGQLQAVTLAGDQVRITLAPASASTPRALLRIEQPAHVAGVGHFGPAQPYPLERGALAIPLAGAPTEVVLVQSGSR